MAVLDSILSKNTILSSFVFTKCHEHYKMQAARKEHTDNNIAECLLTNLIVNIECFYLLHCNWINLLQDSNTSPTHALSHDLKIQCKKSWGEINN